jgi:hypothetical protein
MYNQSSNSHVWLEPHTYIRTLDQHALVHITTHIEEEVYTDKEKWNSRLE